MASAEAGPAAVLTGSLEHDAFLGWRNRPGTHRVLGRTATIDAEGYRLPRGASAGLAIGDSTVYGLGVADEETWPALVGADNAGVSGYGFDQAVLSAELACRVRRPRRLLVGLIPDDLDRCRLSARARYKPYFLAAGSRLALRGVPVPRGAPEAWRIEAPEVDARAVAALLVDRLVELGPPVMLVLYAGLQERAADLDHVAARARWRGATVVDVRDVQRDERHYLTADVDPHRHLSPAGNRLVAERVSEWLPRRDSNPREPLRGRPSYR